MQLNSDQPTSSGSWIGYGTLKTIISCSDICHHVRHWVLAVTCAI